VPAVVTTGEGGSPAWRLGYQPALDGVRALAILPVVVFHAFEWPDGGVLGVHIFFVLSGFLITTLLLQEWNRTGSISLPHFYLRRALRLFPALAVMLAAYVAVQVARELVIEPEALDLRAALEGVLYSVFYVSNVVQASGTVLAVPLVPLWSLATEEQFYLLWPFLLVLALRLRSRPRALEALLIGAIVLIVAHRVRLSLSDASVERLYFAPDTSFDTILIGCLFAVWFVSGRVPRPLRSASVLRWAWLPAAAFVVATIFATSNRSPAMYWGFLLPFSLAVALVVLTVVADRSSAPARLLALPPLVFLGRISYSLYLWHLLVIYFGQRVGIHESVGVVLAVVAATASYYLVERPFLRIKRRDRAEVEGRSTNATRSRPLRARDASLAR
jgi:peptidoglycan/LPS O-acetylase OafA/YrhL